jgi:hypothetical protein
MVLIGPVSGLDSSYLLNTFTSPEAATECHDEKIRIGEEMAKAYPGDESFKIICRERTTIPVEPEPEPQVIEKQI